jgi:hypothetical protein
MQEFVNKKVLVTTSNWFYGKDGKQYRAIHGTLKGITEASKTVGFVPNRTHANWYYEIGNMIIMGCQVMYIELCDEVETGHVTDFSVDTTNDVNPVKEYLRPTSIYVTE